MTKMDVDPIAMNQWGWAGMAILTMNLGTAAGFLKNIDRVNFFTRAGVEAE